MRTTGRDAPYAEFGGMPCFKRSSDKKEPLLGAAPCNCQVYTVSLDNEAPPPFLSPSASPWIIPPVWKMMAALPAISRVR